MAAIKLSSLYKATGRSAYRNPAFQSRSFEDAYNTALDPQAEGGTPPASDPIRTPATPTMPTRGMQPPVTGPAPTFRSYLKDGRWVHDRGSTQANPSVPPTGGIKPPPTVKTGGWKPPPELVPGKLPMYGPWNGRGWRL